MVAALKLVYEFGISTRQLMRHHISHDNFQTLTSNGFIEAMRKKVNIGGEAPQQITVYEITKKGLNWLKKNSDISANRYRLRDDLIVHQLATQAYIQREGWKLLAAASSVAKTVAHRRHTKHIDWQKWQYDALCEVDEFLIALEIERHTKSNVKKNIMLSKLADFLKGYRTDGKIHRIVIACETEELVNQWKRAIEQGFDEYQYKTGTREPQATGHRGIIPGRERSRIDIIHLPLVSVRATALPPANRKATDSAYGHVTPSGKRKRASRLIDEVMAAAAAGEKTLAAKITELQQKAEVRAVERLTDDLKAKIKAVYHDRLIARNRALKQAIDETEAAKAAKRAAEAAKAELEETIEQYKETIADLELEYRNLEILYKRRGTYIYITNQQDTFKEWCEEDNPTLPPDPPKTFSL
ncbi:hypothetical protein BV912_12535 [Neisseria dumasiana]|uniref:Uncharacterized protein n=2 Tax=Neisseria dumasiana TaxID=1931275 RepID=A0A1X3D407_9NEIS|nr:hypothetical protein BV912_12535 [Neisseria dumasiana]